MFIRNNRGKLTSFAYGVFNVAPNKEMLFLIFFFTIFQKSMSVGPYRML